MWISWKSIKRIYLHQNVDEEEQNNTREKAYISFLFVTLHSTFLPSLKKHDEYNSRRSGKVFHKMKVHKSHINMRV